MFILSPYTLTHSPSILNFFKTEPGSVSAQAIHTRGVKFLSARKAEFHFEDILKECFPVVMVVKAKVVGPKNTSVFMLKALIAIN